jgi:molybdopterin converting factor small subunit
VKVQVKLLATLRNRLPPEAKGSASLDLPPGASVGSLLAQLGVAEGQVHAVMVNDAAEPDRGRLLSDGDVVVILPPMAGG